MRIAAGLLCVAAIAATIVRGQAPAKPAPPSPAGLAIQWKQPLRHRDGVHLVVDATRVIASGPRGGIATFARADGRPGWSSTVASVLAPATTGALIGVATAEALVVLHRADGAEAWRAALESPPLALVATPERFIAASAAGLRAWRPDGIDDWRAALDAAPAAAPVAHEGRLLVATADAALLAFDVTSGRRLWRIPLPGEPRGLAFGPDRVYMSVGDALLAYRLTGNPDHAWKHRIVKAIGAPAPADTLVYFSLIDNTVTALDRSGGSRRWSRVMPSRPAAGPMLVDGALVVGLSTGRIVELSPADGRVLSSPAPPELASHRMRTAVAAASPIQVYSVSAGNDGVPVLFGWGRPATETPRSGGRPAVAPPPR
jgi:outer membrane protein assembly factor BamB